MKKNKFNTFIWKSFKLLPKCVRGRLTRYFFEFKLLNNNDFEFKLVETKEELLEAIKIVTDSYKKTGLSDNKKELLINKFHLLPSTRFFISIDKKQKQIIAALAVIQQTSLGFPIKKYCDTNILCPEQERSCEIVSLAIKEENRSRNSGVFFMLILYVVKYLKINMGVNHIFISVRNSVKYFYEDLFNYKAISKPKRYKEVNSVVGIPLYLNIELCIDWLQKNYKSPELSKNIYKLYDTLPWKEHCDFSSQTISNIKLAKDFFDYLTTIKHSCILNLKEKEVILFYYSNNIHVYYKGTLKQNAKSFFVHIFYLNKNSITICGSFSPKSINLELYFKLPKPMCLKLNEFKNINFNLWEFAIDHKKNPHWLEFYNTEILNKSENKEKLVA